MRVFLLGGLIIIVASLVATWSVHAEKASIILTHIQAGAIGDARQELVVLHNTSHDQVDVSEWCLKNKTAIAFFCFTDPHDQLTGYAIPAGKSVVIASAQYIQSRLVPSDTIATFTATSLSTGGSLIASSDTVQLVSATGEVVNEKSWTAGWSTGLVLQRQMSSSTPPVFIDTWQTTPLETLPQHSLVTYKKDLPECEVDCVAPRTAIKITEVFPNPVGPDTGNEFIELYNESSQEVSLEGLKLVVQSSSVKSFSFGSFMKIAPYSYAVFTDKDVSLVLPNTQAGIMLLGKDGSVISSVNPYYEPPDGESWALIHGQWVYTNLPTPGSLNQESLVKLDDNITPSEVPLPCPDGQYRHPETHRCRKNIIDASRIQAACKDGYYRHTETNRCRKIDGVKTAVQCKPGQERNSATGRCRNARTMSIVDKSILQAKIDEQPQQWYIVVVVGSIVTALIAYGLWEWRYDVGRVLKNIRLKVLKR